MDQINLNQNNENNKLDVKKSKSTGEILLNGVTLFSEPNPNKLVMTHSPLHFGAQIYLLWNDKPERLWVYPYHIEGFSSLYDDKNGIDFINKQLKNLCESGIEDPNEYRKRLLHIAQPEATELYGIIKGICTNPIKAAAYKESEDDLFKDLANRIDEEFKGKEIEFIEVDKKIDISISE